MKVKLAANLVIGGALAALMITWILCQEIPSQSAPRPKPKARAVVRVRPEEKIGERGGFESVVESAGAAVQGKHVEARRPKGEPGDAAHIPLSIDWPTGAELPEICEAFGFVLAEMGPDGRPLGRIDPASLGGPLSPWAPTGPSMSNRVRTLPSLAGTNGNRRVSVLIPAAFDKEILDRQMAAAAGLGLRVETVRRQVGGFVRDERGKWGFVIKETQARQEGTR